MFQYLVKHRLATFIHVIYASLVNAALAILTQFTIAA
ncbi:MAG: hypothetical protein MOGMAGMI_02046 [Candidatus Omnitrophica bacterium]|jgi:hypothetical protein|nr:hypothetical protein [Candidatus Omnitrophota bacterium]